MWNPKEFRGKWTSLQSVNLNLWVAHENLFEFIKSSEKTKYQYRKRMEKFGKEKYILNSFSETASSFYKNIQIKPTFETRKDSKGIYNKVRIIAIKFTCLCRKLEKIVFYDSQINTWKDNITLWKFIIWNSR